MATFKILKADNSIIEENISEEAANALFENEEQGQEFSYFWFPLDEEIHANIVEQHGEQTRFVIRNSED